MVRPAPDPESFLPLKADVLQILLALADRDRHGYGLIQDVAAATAGQMQLQPGALYRRLEWLLDAGVIAELERRRIGQASSSGEDARRRSYRLTTFGRRVVRLEVERMEQVVSLARRGRALGRSRS